MPGKELVTETCVRQMACGSELVLGPNKIATPAALDLAFQRELLEARHVDLVVEMTDVADDRVVLHLLHVFGRDDVEVPGSGDEDVEGSRRS